MTPDREQIRRDAEAVIAGNGSSVNVIYLAEKCLALLSELEQAERERDTAQAHIKQLIAEKGEWRS